MILSTISIRKVISTDPLMIGTYKSEVIAGELVITTPLMGLTDQVVSKSRIAKFKLDPSLMPGHANPPDGIPKPPHINVLRGASDKLVTSPTFLPILHNTGININKVSVANSGITGTIVYTDHTGEIHEVDFTTELNSTIFSTSDEAMEKVTNFVPNRMLRVRPLSEAGQQTALDINKCFYGDLNGRSAVWIPVMGGTTSNYPNKGNRIEGYIAVPELITDVANESLSLEVDDFIYMATVESTDPSSSVFGVDDAANIVKDIPGFNNSKIKWLAVMFNNLNGYITDTSFLVKLYNIKPDGTAVLVNWASDGATDWFEWNNGAPALGFVADDWFIEIPAASEKTHIPSLLSRVMGAKLVVRESSNAPTSMQFTSIHAYRTDTNRINIYISESLARLKVKDPDTRGTALLFKINDPDGDLWDEFLKLTHVNVHYGLEPPNSSEGVGSVSGLVIRVTDTPDTIELRYNKFHDLGFIGPIDIGTYSVIETIPDIVIYGSAGNSQIYYSWLNSLSSLDHYYTSGKSILINVQESSLVQAGDQNISSAEDIRQISPRHLAVLPRLKSVMMATQTSGKEGVWTADLDATTSDEVNFYTDISMYSGMDLSLPEGEIVFTILSREDITTDTELLEFPVGITSLSFAPRTGALTLVVGETTYSTNLTNVETGTELINVKLTKITDGTKIELFKQGVLLYHKDTINEFRTALTLHTSYKRLLNAATIIYNNLAFYPKGNKITGDRMLPLERIEDGDVPKADRVSYIVHKKGNANDADRLHSYVEFLIPKFYLDDNPFLEGLYKTRTHHNIDTDDVFGLALEANKFIKVMTLPVNGIPSTPQPVVTQPGGSFLRMMHESGPLDKVTVVGEIFPRGADLEIHQIESASLDPYADAFTGSYDESNLANDSITTLQDYVLKCRLDVEVTNSAINVPDPMEANTAYVVKDNTTNYLLLSAGLINNDDLSDGVVVIKLSAALSTATIDHLAFVGEYRNPPLGTTVPTTLVPTPDNGDLLMVGKDHAFTYSFRQASNGAWPTTDMTGIPDELPKLSKLRCVPIRDSILNALDPGVFDGPKLLPLISYANISDIPATIQPNTVIFTSDSGNPVILMPSAWLTKQTNDLAMIQVMLDNANRVINEKILMALALSPYILVDNTTTNGSMVNMDISDPGRQILALCFNNHVPNPGPVDGFTINLAYWHDSQVVKHTWEAYTTAYPSITTAVNLYDIALPDASSLSIPSYPHGVLAYRSDADGFFASVTEDINDTEHEIELTLPARALFSNATNNNMLKFKFVIATQDRAAYTNTAPGLCVGPHESFLSDNTLPFTKGNIAFIAPNLGTYKLFWSNGLEWNDMLNVEMEIEINDTHDDGHITLADCHTLIPKQDIFTTPLIMRVKHTTSGGVRGDQVAVTLGDGVVRIYIPGIWLSLNRDDRSVKKFETTEQLGLAINSATAIVMYSGTNTGSIGSLPIPGEDTETVILSRTTDGIIMHVLKDGVSQGQLVMPTLTSTVQIPPGPTIANDMIVYEGGFHRLTKSVGIGVCRVREVDDLGEQDSNEVTYLKIANDAWLFIPSHVVSGDRRDQGVVRVVVSDIALRNVLESEPVVCLFNGPIVGSNLNHNGVTRVYIGTSTLNTVDIAYNNQGDPFTTLGEVETMPTGLHVPNPFNHTWLPCEDVVGCNMGLQSGIIKEIHPVNMTTAIPGANTNEYVVEPTYVVLPATTSHTPVNLAFPMPNITGLPLEDCIELEFRYRPIGIVSIQPVGLPNSKSEFTVLVTEKPANLISYHGPNRIPSTNVQGHLIRFSRYPGIPVVITNAETGSTVDMVTVRTLRALGGSSSDTRDIHSGEFKIRISLVKTSLGSYIYVYEGDELICYTQSPYQWYVPKAFSLHFHSNMLEQSRVIVEDAKIVTRTLRLSCLPEGAGGDIDCPNKEANLSRTYNLALQQSVKHLVCSLAPMSEYGYLHITMCNPVSVNATFKIYVTSSRSPVDADLIDSGTYVVEPGTAKERPLVRISGDERLFVESSTGGTTVRVWTMEQVREL